MTTILNSSMVDSTLLDSTIMDSAHLGLCEYISSKLIPTNYETNSNSNAILITTLQNL